MFSNMKKGAIAIATTVIITGCQMSESIRYIHQPSNIFYENFDIARSELIPFTDDEIMFATSIKEAGFDEYWIWLGFYTKKRTASVFVKEVSITGNGLNKDITINKKLSINEPTERDSQVFDLRTNGIKLIEISAEDLMKFVDKNNEMTIEVVYVLENEVKEMTFIIEKKVEKRIIYPT